MYIIWQVWSSVEGAKYEMWCKVWDLCSSNNNDDNKDDDDDDCFFHDDDDVDDDDDKYDEDDDDDDVDDGFYDDDDGFYDDDEGYTMQIIHIVMISETLSMLMKCLKPSHICRDILRT